MELFKTSLICSLIIVVLSHGRGNSARRTSRYSAVIELSKYKYATNQEFLSVAVGTRTLLRTVGRRAQFKMESPRLAVLLRPLSPCTLRVGGSWANFLIFRPDLQDSHVVPDDVIHQWEETFGGDFWGGRVGDKDWYNMAYSGWQWARLVNYTRDEGWGLLFDINQFLQKDGLWDEINFRLLLDYSRQYGIRVDGFQLGNEPNAYQKKMGWNKTVESMAADYKKFRRVLNDYPEFRHVQVVGPDPTSLARGLTAKRFLERFLVAGGAEVLNAIGLHHYYFNGKKATEQDFLDPREFDKFHTLTKNAVSVRDRHAPDLPIYMTETANAYGGGSQEFSHSFISTFVWLDELAMCAKHGISRVHRQSFNSANYALIDAHSVNPHPDYYVAVLYKRLVEGPVLHVLVHPRDPRVRVYAHCARRDFYNLPKGATVVYFINLKADPVTLDFRKTYGMRYVDVYILTSGDTDNLTSPVIRMNGQPLQMKGDDLPELSPQQSQVPLTVPKYSLGFLVFRKGLGKACHAHEFRKKRKGSE